MDDTQDFWIYKDANPATASITRIFIRNNCEICGCKLTVCTAMYSLVSFLDSNCEHYETFTDIWEKRITDVCTTPQPKVIEKSYGISCYSCKEFFPHAEVPLENVDFKCWNCRKYPFYK